MAQGPTPENILFMIHEAFESLIMEFFQGVHYDYQLPCPECLKQVRKIHVVLTELFFR